MGRWKAEERIPGFHNNRRRHHLGQLDEFFGRAGFDYPATGYNQRPSGLGEQSCRIFQGIRVSREPGNDVGAVRVGILDSNGLAQEVAW